MKLGLSKQRGVVMVVALIMLLAVTVMIVTASQLAQTDMRIVNNMESQEQARASALAAIEEAISSGRFTNNPDSVFDSSCDDNQKCYDINGDGEDDITVIVQPPSCVIVTPIENAALDVFNNAADASCFLPPAVYSMCANSVWEFQATAIDNITGAQVSVRQGVSILTTLNAIDTACPV